MYHLSQNINDYDVGQILGRGGFACVYRARERLTGCEVAIKIIEKQSQSLNANDAAAQYQRIEGEIKVHSKLHHKNIAVLFSAFEDENAIYMVMEV